MTSRGADITCIRFVELVTDYLDGALPADETAVLDEHLQRCPGCESVLEQFRLVIATTGRLREAHVDALTPHERGLLMAAFRDWAATRGRS
jgi:anti-sigma factor RsiW